MSQYQFVNAAISFLSGAISATDTTCHLVNPAPFLPLTGWQMWLIDSELIIAQLYAAGVWTIARGAEGTTAVAHSTSAPVYAIVTAASLHELAAEPLIDSATGQFIYETANGDILMGT